MAVSDSPQLPALNDYERGVLLYALLQYRDFMCLTAGGTRYNQPIWNDIEKLIEKLGLDRRRTG